MATLIWGFLARIGNGEWCLRVNTGGNYETILSFSLYNTKQKESSTFQP